MFKKLVTCKTCGHDIAKNAKRCPNCGAQQHVGVQAFVGIAVGLFIVAFVFIIRSVFTPNNSGAPHDELPVLTITSEELYRSYAENTVRADNTFKGKTIRIVGVIEGISQDVFSDAPCVSLYGTDTLGLYTVQCFFENTSDNRKKVSDLRKGQTVEIIGKCYGVSISNIQINNCRLNATPITPEPSDAESAQ